MAGISAEYSTTTSSCESQLVQSEGCSGENCPSQGAAPPPYTKRDTTITASASHATMIYKRNRIEKPDVNAAAVKRAEGIDTSTTVSWSTITLTTDDCGAGHASSAYASQVPASSGSSGMAGASSQSGSAAVPSVASSSAAPLVSTSTAAISQEPSQGLGPPQGFTRRKREGAPVTVTVTSLTYATLTTACSSSSAPLSSSAPVLCPCTSTALINPQSTSSGQWQGDAPGPSAIARRRGVIGRYNRREQAPMSLCPCQGMSAVDASYSASASHSVSVSVSAGASGSGGAALSGGASASGSGSAALSGGASMSGVLISQVVCTGLGCPSQGAAPPPGRRDTEPQVTGRLMIRNEPGGYKNGSCTTSGCPTQTYDIEHELPIESHSSHSSWIWPGMAKRAWEAWTYESPNSARVGRALPPQDTGPILRRNVPTGVCTSTTWITTDNCGAQTSTAAPEPSASTSWDDDECDDDETSTSAYPSSGMAGISAVSSGPSISSTAAEASSSAPLISDQPDDGPSQGAAPPPASLMRIR
ncbi:hypothetical protein BD324DRAFT_611031 [Kockovaella imperatae]|uniref:Uncharacterized protein n=1 Tax=Kockovaella imperatae TaxID=4999 RepID=A0A1Y1USJ3_9TREE|nr:hypothetical protein BD324DRAFT_611031 [Kockovaella imperatae]ORX40504.1 hypothetical protein BD324DRAFT_611031 [Kockovaella imperatae]